MFILFIMHQLLDQARELQLMADDKDEHRQSLKRILIECSEHHKSKEDQLYLNEKHQEVKDVRKYLTTSFNLLNNAQEGLSSSQTEENIRVTGLQYHSQNQASLIKARMNTLSHQSRKTFLNSILSRRKSFSQRSHISPPSSKRTENNNKQGHDRLSLPILMNKIKMSKKPANASKNSSLDLADNKKPRVEEDHTYDQIRSQRQKVEELRHLTVLGRVLGQNYKKHLKKLQERKKLFIRSKLHSQY